MYAWLDRHRVVLDWLFGVVWAAVGIRTDFANAAEVAAGVLSAPAIALRRTHPGWALAAAWACALAQMLSMHAPLPWATMAILVALAGAARAECQAVRVAAAISTPAGALVAGAYLTWFPNRFLGGDTGQRLVASTVSALVFLGAAWLVGTLARTRERYRASRVESSNAARAAAAARERTELARDMHDVLAHSLSVIVSLSDGTRLATPDLPAPAADRLREISEVGRAALTDVRTLLARLRRAEGADGETTPTTIDTLLAQMRDAGLDVRVRERGRAAALTSPVYRTLAHLVREALTNALRHGDRSLPVTLTIAWGDPVNLEVRNARATERRRGHASTGAEHWGILGMRERVALVGGTLSCGPEQRDWVVHARIPARAPGEDEARAAGTPREAEHGLD